MKATHYHLKYWRNRKLDWDKAYSSTWNHPHRILLAEFLMKLQFMSLLEVGCASAPNLITITKRFQKAGRQVMLQGVDVNQDAIQQAEKQFNGARFRVNPAHDLFYSDNSVDVILTDMTLIYYDPVMIRKALAEFARVSRHYVVLVEFHHPSFKQRAKLWLKDGYFAYNYKKLLGRQGFRDVNIFKIPPDSWPGGWPQDVFANIILAKVPL